MERISSSSLRSMVASLLAMTLFPHRHPPVPGAAALLWRPKWKPPGAPAGPEAHPPLTVVGWCLHAVHGVQRPALHPGAVGAVVRFERAAGEITFVRSYFN